MLVRIQSQDGQKKPRLRGFFLVGRGAAPTGLNDSHYFFFGARSDSRSAAAMKLFMRSSAIDHHCT